MVGFSHRLGRCTIGVNIVLDILRQRVYAVNVFAKIFAQIFDSSIAGDYVVRHVFMDLLVLADRDGVVDMTLDAIARRTNVPENLIAHAIQELSNPDIKSRSPIEGGRRIVPLDSHRDWGWQIVNFDHYRAIRDEESRKTYFRDYKRQYRKSKTATNSPHLSTSVLDSKTMSTEGEGEVEREVITPLPPKPDTADTRILCESVGIFGMKEQADMNRLLAVYVKESGHPVDDAISHLTARWTEYQGHAQNLEWQYGSAYKFFMSGKWDTPTGWPFKEGVHIPAMDRRTDEEKSADRKAQEQRAYEMWSTMGADYQQKFPWKGEIPA